MRRNFWVLLQACLMGVFFFGSLPLMAQGGSDTILLEKPVASFNIDLMEAFKARHSTKAYEKKEISPKDLGTLLWAGFGVNREDGKRTVPSARGQYFVKLYVVAASGTYLYEPKDHALRLISNQPVKDSIGVQPYVAEASHVLVLVVDPNLYTLEATTEQKLAWGTTTIGCIGQNIYLAAAGLKLGTSFVASLNAKVAREALKLGEAEVPLFIMPIGYPKAK